MTSQNCQRGANDHCLARGPRRSLPLWLRWRRAVSLTFRRFICGFALYDEFETTTEVVKIDPQGGWGVEAMAYLEQHGVISPELWPANYPGTKPVDYAAFDVTPRLFDLTPQPIIRVRNSWGPQWAARPRLSDIVRQAGIEPMNPDDATN